MATVAYYPWTSNTAVLPCEAPTPTRAADLNPGLLPSPADSSKCPSTTHLLFDRPFALFLETGQWRKLVQQTATNVSPCAAVRVLDTGPDILWGCCSAWARDQLQHFMTERGYAREHTAAADIFRDLQRQVMDHCWPLSSKSRSALLYLRGKARGFRLKSYGALWQPPPHLLYPGLVCK